MKKEIKNVAIVGGTHGNEFTGVYLVKKWKQDHKLVKRKTFDTLTLHANPKATELVRRYVDKDLNRSFVDKHLKDLTLSSHEDNLAKVINEKLGPKHDPKCDFIVDLHTTTANMGLSLVVVNDNPFSYQVAAHLQDKEPDLKLYRWIGDDEQAYLNTIAPMGFAIEVGPIAQGILRADLFQKTEKLVYEILDFIENYNTNKITLQKRKITLYNHYKYVDYPRDENCDINAMVHSKRQNRDFCKIKKGDPLFLDLNGDIVSYKEQEEVYPVFINEAAYYEKGIAMSLTKKIELEI